MDQEIVFLVAASMSPTVMGLPTCAVSTPMLIMVPLMATMNMRAFMMLLLPCSALKACPMPRMMGSMSSVRAVMDGTRKVMTAMTAATAQ